MPSTHKWIKSASDADLARELERVAAVDRLGAMTNDEILPFEETALAREMIAASDPLGGGSERLPDMDAGFSRFDRPRNLNSSDDIRFGMRRFHETKRTAPLERLDVAQVKASLSKPYRRSKRSKIPFKKSWLTSFRDDHPVRFVRFDIDAHFPHDGHPLWPDDDGDRLKAVIAKRDRNKRLLMDRFQALGIEALWTESPGDTLHFFRMDGSDDFDRVRVTGYYAFVRITPHTPAELRDLCAAFQSITGIEVSWATPKRLIRLPGQPGTPAIDPETCERIEQFYDDECPRKQQMATAMLVYEDLRPVKMLEALLSCEGLPEECVVETEERFDMMAVWAEEENEYPWETPPSEYKSNHSVPERDAERSGIPQEPPKQPTPHNKTLTAPQAPPKRLLAPLSLNDACTFTASTKYASIATHAIGGDAARVDEGVELVLDDFIESRPESSRTCSNRDEAARLLHRNILFMCRNFDPSKIRGIGPDVTEARRVQRKADERRIVRSLRLRDSHVVKAARMMGTPDWFVKKLTRFLPIYRNYAGRVAATALRKFFTKRELAWFRKLFVVVREFVQGFRCRQWGLHPAIADRVEGMSGGTVAMEEGRKAGGRNLYVNTVTPPVTPKLTVRRPQGLSLRFKPLLLPAQRWKPLAKAAFTAETVRA